MAKVVIRRRRDNRKPANNPYRELGEQGSGEHPVDRAVEVRLHHAGVRRQMGRLKQRILRALGDEASAMFDLEALYADSYAEREEAYFNIGFEHGFVVGGARARRGSQGWSAAVSALRKRIAAQVANADVVSTDAALALVDALRATLLRWAMVEARNERHESKL